MERTHTAVVDQQNLLINEIFWKTLGNISSKRVSERERERDPEMLFSFLCGSVAVFFFLLLR